MVQTAIITNDTLGNAFLDAGTWLLNNPVEVYLVEVKEDTFSEKWKVEITYFAP